MLSLTCIKLVKKRKYVKHKLFRINFKGAKQDFWQPQITLENLYGCIETRKKREGQTKS